MIVVVSLMAGLLLVRAPASHVAARAGQSASGPAATEAVGGAGDTAVVASARLQVHIESPVPPTGHVLVERQVKRRTGDVTTHGWQRHAVRPVKGATLTFALPPGVYRSTLLVGELRSVPQRVTLRVGGQASLTIPLGWIEIIARSATGPAWAECWLERSSHSAVRRGQKETWRLVANPGLEKGRTRIAVLPGRYRLKLCAGVTWTPYRLITIDGPEQAQQRFYFTMIELPAAPGASGPELRATLERIAKQRGGGERRESLGSWALQANAVAKYLEAGRYRVCLAAIGNDEESECGCTTPIRLRWMQGVRVRLPTGSRRPETTPIELFDVAPLDVALLFSSPIALAQHGVEPDDMEAVSALLEQVRRGRQEEADVPDAATLEAIAAAASPVPDERWSKVLQGAVQFVFGAAKPAKEHAAFREALRDWINWREQRHRSAQGPNVPTSQAATRPGV